MSVSADRAGGAMPTKDASIPAPPYQEEAKGRLELRSRLSEDGTKLLIEVADDGVGAEQSLIDRAFEPGAYDDDGGRPRTGLTKAVIEQHGGRFGIESEPGEGTYAQIRLPLRG